MQNEGSLRFFVVFFFIYIFLQLFCPNGILPREILVAFHEESQLQQSRATQPIVHAGCFSVSIILGTLTWTTGSVTGICDLFVHTIYEWDLGI